MITADEIQITYPMIKVSLVYFEYTYSQNFGRNNHSKLIHTEQNTVHPVLYNV